MCLDVVVSHGGADKWDRFILVQGWWPDGCRFGVFFPVNDGRMCQIWI